MVTNEPFDILFTNFPVVEKELDLEMVIDYATTSPFIHLAVTGTVVDDGIRESITLMVDQTRAATMRQPESNVTDLRIKAPGEKTQQSTSTSQISL